MPHLSFAALANPRRGNVWLVVCVLLAASVIAVEFINPNLLPQPKVTPMSAYRPYGDGGRQALAGTRVCAAEVVRIIDGDTFVARMRTGPGGEVETRVRLRRIDAAELHARCSKELRLALAARGAATAARRRKGHALPRRARQISRTHRRQCGDPQHQRHLGRDALRRLRTHLRRRAARHLVQMRGVVTAAIIPYFVMRG